MKNKPEIRNIIILIFILVIFSTLYIVMDKIFNKEESFVYLKNYEVNEYIPTYVSDQSMARIYLNDYIYTMYTDIEKAYQLLNEDYRNKKYGNIDNFRNYVKSLSYESYIMDEFYVNDKGIYKIFGVYDTNGNVFIFKTNGVMQYEVYLDEYTVEI